MAKTDKVKPAKLAQSPKMKVKSPEQMKAEFMAGLKADVDLKPFNKSKRIMLYALKKTKGNVSEAAKMIGINRRQYYFYKKDDPAFEEMFDEIKYEINTDRVESKLLERCEQGSDYLIKYYMECHGKDRGYGASIKIDHTTKGESLNKTLNNMTDEELEAKLKELNEKMK